MTEFLFLAPSDCATEEAVPEMEVVVDEEDEDDEVEESFLNKVLSVERCV
jgi:hypothetical protein